MNHVRMCSESYRLPFYHKHTYLHIILMATNCGVLSMAESYVPVNFAVSFELVKQVILKCLTFLQY